MKKTGWIKTVPLFIIILLIAGYVTAHLPAQRLHITASTEAAEYDMSGSTDIWYLMPLSAGTKHIVEIQFMAVKSKTGNLFTSHGTGQFVYMGCGKLTSRCEFISIGRFLHITLTMNAAQTELKLEDGTPFDKTRYSLKPVLIIEE